MLAPASWVSRNGNATANLLSMNNTACKFWLVSLQHRAQLGLMGMPRVLQVSNGDILFTSGYFFVEILTKTIKEHPEYDDRSYQ